MNEGNLPNQHMLVLAKKDHLYEPKIEHLPLCYVSIAMRLLVKAFAMHAATKSSLTVV